MDNNKQETLSRLKFVGRVKKNEKINYKVREHSLGKVPVILAVGAREVEEDTVTVRRLGQKQTEVNQFNDIIAILSSESTPPDLRK